jgi:hypothetical protein
VDIRPLFGPDDAFDLTKLLAQDVPEKEQKSI